MLYVPRVLQISQVVADSFRKVNGLRRSKSRRLLVEIWLKRERQVSFACLALSGRAPS